ncbi:MAG TPA: helix-turn-helix domain-containing protein [Planctomycetaceae bacterium]|nr:helix-turn-helix domain-containing protein [Planctomycetaceae bacterium]
MSTATKRRKKPTTADRAEVLTLREAAEYLRAAEDDVLELATRGDLPGRKIKDEWRFHRRALADWLCRPSPRERLLRHAGAAQDDPYLDEMLEQIYRERGRVMVEERG